MQAPPLDTPARRIGAAVLVVAGAAVVVLAVLTIAGSGPLAGEDTPTTEEAVTETVERFLGSLADQDYAAACELLTEEVRAQLRGGECAQVLAAVLGATTVGAPDVELTDIRISGNQAAVDALVTGESGESRESSLELLEDNGQWLISSFGG